MSEPDYRCSHCDMRLCLCEVEDYRCVKCHNGICNCKINRIKQMMDEGKWHGSRET